MKKKQPRYTDLPVYEIELNDDTQGIRLVSLVADPAIEVMGMYFSNDELENEKNYEFKVMKDKQIIAGPAMIPNRKIIRKDADGNLYYVVFKPETINLMVERFNNSNNNRSINIDHSNQMVDGFIMSNWIIADPTYDKSRYYGFNNLPIGTWFIECKINDTKFWNDEVKGQGKYGFSIEGLLSQKLTENYNNQIDKIIDSLTDDEIIEMFGDILSINVEKFVVKPNSGESKDDFISRCIAEEINSGYEQDQAAAICYAKWDEGSYAALKLGAKKVSFDFDGTLTQKSVQETAKRMIEAGDDVYIVTKRSPSKEVKQMALDLGIKLSNVIFTNHHPKWSYLKRFEIDEHYDNSPDEIKEISDKTDVKTHLV